MKQKTPEQDVAEFSPGDLFGIGMGIVVLIIGISFGLDVMEDTQEDMCDYNFDDGGCRECANATFPLYNATGNTCYNSTGGEQAYTGAETVGFNATGDGITATAKIPGKMGIYVTILMAAAIIGLLTRYLWNRGAM